MEQYEKPEIEVIVLEAEDIITDSGDIPLTPTP